MKTQNMIVLTVEFTRIPLFPAGEKPMTGTPAPPASSLDARRFLEVTAKYAKPDRQTQISTRLDEQ